MGTLCQNRCDLLRIVQAVLQYADLDQFSGGQRLIEHTVEKPHRLPRPIDPTRSKALIEIDGGVNRETGARLVAAGADVLVAGSAIFGAADPVAEVAALRAL